MILEPKSFSEMEATQINISLQDGVTTRQVIPLQKVVRFYWFNLPENDKPVYLNIIMYGLVNSQPVEVLVNDNLIKKI